MMTTAQHSMQANHVTSDLLFSSHISNIALACKMNLEDTEARVSHTLTYCLGEIPQTCKSTLVTCMPNLMPPCGRGEGGGGLQSIQGLPNTSWHTLFLFHAPLEHSCCTQKCLPAVQNCNIFVLSNKSYLRQVYPVSAAGE